MKRIAKLEDKLATLRNQLKLTRDPDEAAELGERIDFIQDEIAELEEAEAEQASYEEATENLTEAIEEATAQIIDNCDSPPSEEEED